MSRVFLLNPPYKPNFIRSARSTWPSISGSNWYPIFLAYATGWLEKHGESAKLLDALVEGLSVEDTLAAARRFRPDLLVLYVSKDSLENDIRIGSRIKDATGCYMVLVGPWCAEDPAGILGRHPAADAVVPREFEEAVLRLSKGHPKSDIPGLVYRIRGAVKINPGALFLTSEQLDSMPYVTAVYRKHLHIEAYHQASLLHPFVDLFTSRGCVWGKCTFCLWPNTIQKHARFRMRSISSVIGELRYIRRYLPEVREVFIQDDTLSAGRAREMSEAIIAAGLEVTWSCYVRATMDYQTLALMKRAGCRYLHVGYESADQRILNSIRKGTNVREMERFTADTKRAELLVHGDFIIGLPGETERTIRKTITWAKRLGIEGYQFFIPQPQPETPFYAWLKSKGYLGEDGRIDYPDLSYERMMYWRFAAMRSIYFTPVYISRILKRITEPGELYRMIRTSWHVIPSLLAGR